MSGFFEEFGGETIKGARAGEPAPAGFFEEFGGETVKKPGADHEECDSCKAGGPCTGCHQEATPHGGSLYDTRTPFERDYEAHNALPAQPAPPQATGTLADFGSSGPTAAELASPAITGAPGAALLTGGKSTMYGLGRAGTAGAETLSLKAMAALGMIPDPGPVGQVYDQMGRNFDREEARAAAISPGGSFVGGGLGAATSPGLPQMGAMANTGGAGARMLKGAGVGALTSGITAYNMNEDPTVATVLGGLAGMLPGASTAVRNRFGNRANRLEAAAKEGTSLVDELDYRKQVPELREQRASAIEDMRIAEERADIAARNQFDEQMGQYDAEVRAAKVQDDLNQRERAGEVVRREKENAAALERYQADEARIKEAQAAAKAERQAQIRAGKEDYEQRKVQAGAEAEAETARLRAEAQERAQTITPDNAAKFAGITSQMNKVGGSSRAREVGEALLNEPIPGQPGTSYLRAAEQMDTEARLANVREYKAGAGEELGAFRKLARERKAPPVPATQIIRDFETRLGASNLGSDAKQAAMEDFVELVDKATKEGGVDADRMQSLLENLGDRMRFGNPALEGRVGRAQGRIYSTGYGTVSDAYKTFFTEAELPRFNDALRRYGLWADAEMGAESLNATALNKGARTVERKAAPVKDVKPAPVAKPSQPPPLALLPKAKREILLTDADGRTYTELPKPLDVADTPLPDKPELNLPRRDPGRFVEQFPKVPSKKLFKNDDELDAAMERLLGSKAWKNVTKNFASGTAYTAASAKGGLPAGAAAGSAARELTDLIFNAVSPQVPKKAAARLKVRSAAAKRRLDRYGPALTRIAQMGPGEAAQALRALFRDPEFAEAVQAE